jgi:hypothetical protein
MSAIVGDALVHAGGTAGKVRSAGVEVLPSAEAAELVEARGTQGRRIHSLRYKRHDNYGTAAAEKR